MAAKPKRIKLKNIVLKLQAGTTDTLLATWTWDRDHTYGYEVVWEYLTKDGIWFIGKEDTVGTTTGRNKYDTYEIPSLATKVRIKIRPISTSYETGSGNNESSIVTPENNPNASAMISGSTSGYVSGYVITNGGGTVRYWHAEWSGYKNYKVIPDLTPDVPSVPEMSIDDLTITLRNMVYDENTTHIRYEIYGDTYKDSFTTSWIKVDLNEVSFSKSVHSNSKYRARAKAYNRKDKSESEWSNWTSYEETIPDKISEFNVEALSSTSVRINLTVGTTTATNYEVEYATDPDYFDQSSLAQSLSVGTEHPYIIVEGLETGKRWYFRVRTSNSKGASMWVGPSSIVIGTTPTAPTVWSSTATAVYGETVTLYWIHNSEDESRERKAELQITRPGKEMQTIVIEKEDDSEISSYDVSVTDLTEEGEVTWQVRTEGAIDGYGPYSETLSFKILIQPTLGIAFYKTKEWLWDPFNFETDDIYTAKGAYAEPYDSSDLEIEKYPFHIVVTMYPLSQTPIECNFSIYATNSYRTLDNIGKDMWVNEGDQLFSKDVVYIQNQEEYGITKNQIPLFITPGDVILENFTTYKLVCTVISDNTLSAVGEITFTMNIEEEELIPDAEIGVDRNTLIAYIKPTCYDEDGNEIAGVRMSVYRRQFDGGLIQVGSEIASQSNITIVDPHPNLNYSRYRIVGYSNNTGSFFYYDMPAYPINVPEIILQWDERWEDFDSPENDSPAEPVWRGSMLRLPYNIDVSEGNTIDVELVEYIGREHPVSYYGTQVGQNMTLNADVPKVDNETIYALRRLSRYMGDVYVREPNGAGYWAQVSISLSSQHKEVTIPVTISVTRVEGGE